MALAFFALVALAFAYLLRDRTPPKAPGINTKNQPALDAFNALDLKIATLSLKPGDTVIVHSDKPMSPKESREFIDYLRFRLPAGTQLAHLPHGVSLSVQQADDARKPAWTPFDRDTGIQVSNGATSSATAALSAPPADEWNYGPPPSLGWWPVRLQQHDPKKFQCIGWWNGRCWAVVASDRLTSEEINLFHSPDEFEAYRDNQSIISWLPRPDSWPEHSRT